MKIFFVKYCIIKLSRYKIIKYLCNRCSLSKNVQTFDFTYFLGSESSKEFRF